MECPIISIIIPSYQQGRYLSEALESVIDQTLQNWEAIVINDGSIDETEMVARKYAELDNRIKYYSQENSGVACARNNAIKKAKGMYILPLDADDKIAPTYLEKAVEFLSGHPDYAVFTCIGRLFGDCDEVWNVHYSGYSNLLLHNGVFNSSVYKKEDWLRIGCLGLK